METMPERLRAVLASHPGVRLGYVFGSAARGALRADSDVDVAVRFATRPTLDGLAALALNLERAAGRRVDVIDLDTAPPLLLREVVKEGRLLFAPATTSASPSRQPRSRATPTRHTCGTSRRSTCMPGPRRIVPVRAEVVGGAGGLIEVSASDGPASTGATSGAVSRAGAAAAWSASVFAT